MYPVLIWKYQNAVPTVRNSPEYLYEISNMKKFRRAIFSLRLPCSLRYGSSLDLEHPTCNIS